MEYIYTTEARSVGQARDGRAYLTDGTLEIQMAQVEELGGSGQGANPEQLFALGYATCFHQAVKKVARQMQADASSSSVQSRISFGLDEQGLQTLAVGLEVSLPYVEMAQARDIAMRAHAICPYSRAPRGNIEVIVDVVEE